MALDSLQYEQDLLNVKILRLKGQFKDAWICLDKISPDAANSLRLVIAKAHLLTVQGQYNHVVKISEPIVHKDHSILMGDEIRVLKLLLASAKIETEGKLLDAQELAIFSWNELSDAGEVEDISSLRCSVVLCLAQITFRLQKYAKYATSINDNFKSQLNERMRSIQLNFQETRNYPEAWEMLQHRLFMLNHQECDRELLSFLGESKANWTSALATLELSKIAGIRRQFAEALELLDGAKELFALSGLALGNEEVKLEAVVQHINSLEANNLSNESLHSLEGLAESFHNLEYPVREFEILSLSFTLCREAKRFSDLSRISAKIEELCDVNGLNLEWCKQKFLQLGIWNLLGDEMAPTLEGFTALFSKAEMMQTPGLASLCAIELSANYWQQRDFDNSFYWAERALTITRKLGDAVLASQAAKTMALVMREKLTLNPEASRDEFDELLEFLSKSARADGENGLVDDQIDKYGILSGVEIQICRRFNDPDKLGASERCLQWLQEAEQLVPYLPEEEKLINIAEINFKSSDAFDILGDFPAAIGYLELAKMQFTQAGEGRKARHMQNKIAQLQLLSVYESLLAANSDLEEAESKLNESLANFRQVQNDLLKSGSRRKLANCHLQQAWLWQSAYDLGQQDALQMALEELEIAEDIQNGVRADMTIQKDEEILLHKRALVAENANIYELGIKLSLAQKDFSRAWKWTQQGKARAFLDFLSFEQLLPAVITKSANESKEAQDLLAKEATLMENCNTVSKERRFPIRQGIAEIRRQMESVPQLYEVLLYRGIKTLSLDRLAEMFSGRKDIVCVDWALVDDSIWMFTVRPGEQPKAHSLAITKAEVRLWIESNLKAEYMRQKRAAERMKDLGPLIAPLAEVSKEDELLILCPSGLLCALPLHALEVSGKILLERNPVVYSSSLSVLHHCLLRRSENVYNFNNSAIFGNPTEDRTAAGESAADLARILNVKPFIGSAATKAAFKERFENTAIFHYHGHAAFDAEDPLNSAFKLHQPDTWSAENDLTARELLQFHLSVALFIMIACESAQQDIKAGEEPTGLLPMLLLAGANATIGTLWKCSDIAGKEFTEAFYSALSDQIADRSNIGKEVHIVNIATALRRAALEIRKKRPAPYFWALFVLHGNWQCQFAQGVGWKT